MQSIKWRKRNTFQEAINIQIKEVEEKLEHVFSTTHNCFWDHEIAYEDKESSISYVCDSFTDLIDKLE
ncbi:hypothetical protein [Bacillus sp. 0102A]|uniref:hypothetical protein n=1 Tax=Bacillus sp. 0102A TaxID=3120563 RepID=UPI002FDA8830